MKNTIYYSNETLTGVNWLPQAAQVIIKIIWWKKFYLISLRKNSFYFDGEPITYNYPGSLFSEEIRARDDGILLLSLKGVNEETPFIGEFSSFIHKLQLIINLT